MFVAAKLKSEDMPWHSALGKTKAERPVRMQWIITLAVGSKSTAPTTYSLIPAATERHPGSDPIDEV
jgi:hypothetical protein